jgi:hypothetical protein
MTPNPQSAGNKFPAATIAYYGPNDKLATKLVVGIIAKPGGDVIDMRKWASGVVDVRENRLIQEEVLQFIRKHKVSSMIASERIIGCPHEEGDDYPAGGPCPMCHFWQDRDRWTGEMMQE